MLKPYTFQRGKQKGDVFFFCTKQNVIHTKEKCSCLCALQAPLIYIRIGKETLVHSLYILSLLNEWKCVLMFRPVYLSGRSYRSHWREGLGGGVCTADLTTANFCPCRPTNRFSPVTLPIPDRWIQQSFVIIKWRKIQRQNKHMTANAASGELSMDR